MKLYELTDAYLNIAEAAEENDHLHDALKVLDDEIEIKAENIGKIILGNKSEINTLKNEIDRLKTRIQSKKKANDRLQDYLQDNMEYLNKQKIKTPLMTLWIQNNPPSVDVKSEDHIPKEFFEEQKPKLKKRELLDYLKAGHEIEGVNITQTKGFRLR